MIQSGLLTTLCFLFLWIPLTLQCKGPKPPDNSALIAEQARARLQELKLWCHEHCVTPWSVWSPCNSPCGRGKTTRKRQPSESAWCTVKELGNFECTQSKTQTVDCNSGCPYGGLPGNRMCQGCPKSRTGTCCETEIFCSYPPRPSNGKVEGKWPAAPDHLAEFTCNTGFNLQGEDLATCLANTSWSSASPTCEAIQCAQPIRNPNVKILNLKPDGYAFGEQVVYDCEDGYKMIGERSRTCRRGVTGEGVWTGYDVQCKPVECPDPLIPQNGDIVTQSTSFQYKDIIRFKCDQGYKLVGSDALQCLSSGSWFGHDPKCEAITCEPPFAPRNGQVRIRKAGIKAYALFECDDGYRLDPAITTLICTDEGTWNGTEPKCKAASCGDPGSPVHGYRDGGVFTFGNTVKFNCERGYELKSGSKEMECQSNALWSGTLPTCEACKLGFYMKGDKCEICPANSHTAANASTSVVQCLCDSENGFIGPPGGPCEEVFCTELTGPDNGGMNKCQNKVGSICKFGCNPGYVIERGSTVRTCQNTGEWDGTPAFCVPCKLNTYKSGERTCSPCPIHSHTEAPGQVKEGCVCDEGYKGPPGGPCVDVNECTVNSGKGPCIDSCENNEGSFKCRCTIPGYKISLQDPFACVAEHQCRNLTRDDAPENGGLVCHWYYEENSQHCTTKCNPGFEIPSRSNDYETCGPATGYNWTYQVIDPQALLPPCVPEFFPEFRLEGESAYFAAACEDLTEAQKDAAKQEFADRLNEQGICSKRATKVCNIKDMGIICGRTSRRRRRRGTEYTEHSVDFIFNVTALQFEVKTTECPTKICPMLRIPSRYCAQYCKPSYKRYLKAALLYAKRQLQHLYSNPAKLQELVLRVQNLEFDPKDHGFKSSDVLKKCPQGMAAIDDQCVPCRAGSYLDEELNECVVCPVNTYQNKDQQLSCIDCNTMGAGYFTSKNGSTECQVCPEGTYGLYCDSQCDCVNGACSPWNGMCICPSGWEGKRCGIDTNSCFSDSCYPGVACIDQPPPGTGYTCGPCPTGYHGDGITCRPDLRSKRSIGLMSFEL